MAQKDVLLKLKTNESYKRRGLKREIQIGLQGQTAKRVIGDLYHGCEIYGFTKGQFSCINILEHVLQQTGPAEVVICTWSAASGDIRAAHNMLRIGNIKKMRFVVDYSFKSRKPEFCRELIEKFGGDCIRVTSIHAKFMTVKNKDWNVCIRTSMNLNFNPRFENYEISDDVNMLSFMNGVVDDIWKTQEKHEGFESPEKGKRTFKKLYPIKQEKVVDQIDSFDLSQLEAV